MHFPFIPLARHRAESAPRRRARTRCTLHLLFIWCMRFFSLSSCAPSPFRNDGIKQVSRSLHRVTAADPAVRESRFWSVISLSQLVRLNGFWEDFMPLLMTPVLPKKQCGYCHLAGICLLSLWRMVTKCPKYWDGISKECIIAGSLMAT